MKLRCPICHSSNSLEAYCSDADGRELVALLAKSGPLFGPLAAYLGMFRSPSRDLSHSRALRLAREVLDLQADPRALAAALTETVEALRKKRDSGDNRPLTKHNYLLSVLESVALTPALPMPHDGEPMQAAPKGKRRQAVEILAAWAGDDWLRLEISRGLQALCVLPRMAPPGIDSVELTAGLFDTLIRPRCNIFEVDCGRVTSAFNDLLKQPLKEWPEPGTVIANLPRRPEREKLQAPPISESEREKGLKAIVALQQRFDDRTVPKKGPDEEARRRELRDQAQKLKEKGI